MRGPGWCISWCLPWLLLGCQGFHALERPTVEEERAARALETASIRTWTESRPTFPAVDRFLAARAWERNLRLLQLEPKRSENFVQCATPDGQAFCLAFWEDKEGSRGEITWLPSDAAGAGMLSLIELERKHRGANARANAGAKK